MNERCLLIVNPRSGTSSDKGPAIKHAIEAMLAAGISVETVYTERPGHATELASHAAADGVDIVVAVGGDGTVNETARGVCNTSSTLGILPMGSGNGLARHLAIPMNPDKAIKILTAGKTVDCDYCTVNDRPFFCTFGMGYDAAVADRFASRPGSRGFINYLRSAVEELISYKSEEYTITYNGETLREKAFLVACCNASQYGNNAYIAPAASVSDGLMDVTIFHPGNMFRQMRNGIDLMLGSIHQGSRIRTLRASEIIIDRLNPGPAHLDGDPIRLGTHLVVRCHPHALRVLYPGETPPKPKLQ